MREDIHRVVYLNVHVIADCLQLLALCRDDLAVPILDLVRRSAILGEPTGDNDALAILLWPVRFFALVLENDRDLRDTAKSQSKAEHDA